MPILFIDAFRGIELGRECIYIDLDPSVTPSNFAKYNLAGNSVPEINFIMMPFAQDIKRLKAHRRNM